MAKFTTLLLVAVALLTSVVAVTEEFATKAKLKVVVREIVGTIEALGNITLQTPESKVQLACMTNDYISALNLVNQGINNAVPSAVEQEGHDMLVYDAILVNRYTSSLQKVLASDSEFLRKTIIEQLYDGQKEAQNFIEAFKMSSIFGHNQLRRAFDILIFGIYKVKFQSLLFDKSNKELATAISERLPEFTETIKSLSESDKITEEELRHAMHHLTTILERSVYKLENWVEVNPESVEHINVIQEVTIAFGELYYKLVQAANRKNRTPFLKTELNNAVEVVVRNINKLAQINYVNNFGGQEFIRSSVLDFVTFGKAYSDNIKTVLL